MHGGSITALLRRSHRPRGQHSRAGRVRRHQRDQRHVQKARAPQRGDPGRRPADAQHAPDLHRGGLHRGQGRQHAATGKATYVKMSARASPANPWGGRMVPRAGRRGRNRRRQLRLFRQGGRCEKVISFSAGLRARNGRRFLNFPGVDFPRLSADNESGVPRGNQLKEKRSQKIRFITDSASDISEQDDARQIHVIPFP